MSKYTAKSVIKDSFWIVERSGSRVGTIKRQTNSYLFYNNVDKTSIVYETMDSFKLVENETNDTVTATVYGYPTNTDSVFDIDLLDSVPVFKKTATSAIHVAAGYWGIFFPMGWRPSFCPRHRTLIDYPHIGPFKNESDMHLAIKRKGQDND
tara:strand:+ start:1321 stop:1776 length:456 start_codon:yes stop_codon:yes gene_type:complete